MQFLIKPAYENICVNVDECKTEIIYVAINEHRNLNSRARHSYINIPILYYKVKNCHSYTDSHH